MITEANYPTEGITSTYEIINMRKGCNNPNIDCLVSGDTMRYQVFGEGDITLGAPPLG